MVNTSCSGKSIEVDVPTGNEDLLIALVKLAR
jgi:hypothetical protein